MTIPAVSPLAVLGATNTAPIVLEVLAHGLATNDNVAVAGVLGNLAANSPEWTIDVVDANHFSLRGSGGSGAYTGGGGVWAVDGKISSGTLTTFDSYLATRVTDKTGDVVNGQYALDGTPGIAVTTPTSAIRANAAGALIESVSPSGGFVLGDGDDVELNPRTRIIRISCQEIFNEYNGSGGNPEDQGAEILCNGPGVQANVPSSLPSTVQTFPLPLTRLHDKSTLVSATLLFFPNASVLPTTFPTLQLFRYNPSTDNTLTSLAANGAAVFVGTTVAAYNATPAVGSTGNFVLATLNGGNAALVAGQVLDDEADNQFQVLTGGTYANGALVPIQAIAPATGTFFGSNTNDAPGTVLTWATGTEPDNCLAGQPVSSAGLTGGLNAGYAQELVFVPDADLAVIDQSTYVYVAAWTDDNADYVAQENGNETLYVAIELEFANIVAMTPQ